MSLVGLFSKIVRKLESVNLPPLLGIFSSFALLTLGIWLSLKGEYSLFAVLSFLFAVLALVFTKSKSFGSHSARLGSLFTFAVSSCFLIFLFPKAESKWYGDCLITDGGFLEIEIFISIVLAYLSYFAVKKLIKKFLLGYSEGSTADALGEDLETSCSKVICDGSSSKNFCSSLSFKNLGSDSLYLKDGCVLESNALALNKDCGLILREKSEKLLVENLDCENGALMAFDRKLCIFFSLIAYFNKFRLARKFGLGLFLICTLGHVFFGFANAHLYNSCVCCNEANGNVGFVGDIYSWHILDALLFYISILLAVLSLKVKYFGAMFVRFFTFFTFCVLNLMYGYFYSLSFKKMLLVLGVTSIVYLFLRFILVRILIIIKNGIYGVDAPKS
jgi:hypothetical protein